MPLAGHPESFQLETDGKRIFVNALTARQVAVIDRERRAVIATWPVEAAQSNFPMALDETHRRLLIARRKPARMLALDIASGKCVASMPCAGDADDLFYDAKTKRLYVIGGEGSISVFEQIDANHYRLLDAIPTAPGARTGLFVPSTRQLHLAVPHRGAQKAEIRAYEMSN